MAKKSGVAGGVAVPVNEGGHVSVRKIENGYVICHSSAEGGYKETYSQHKPDVTVSAPPGGQNQEPDAGKSSLRDAIDYALRRP